MPCAAGELCELQDMTCEPPEGHVCRGSCGGRLHGFCGQVEDPDCGNEMNRICHSCVAKKAEATFGRSNSAKRKEDKDFLQPNSSKKNKSSASMSRTRLNFGQKVEILKLLGEKVGHAEIARRFKCGTTAIGTIKKERASLENDAAASSRSVSSKSSRGGDFPKVDTLVMASVEEARKIPLPVTRALVMSFGVTAKKKLLTAEITPAGDKKKLETFSASEKWAKNFISRNGIVRTLPDGETGSVDAEAKGLEEIREVCKKHGLENIFNIDETGIFYRLLPNRAYLSKGEKRKTATGAKGMKAKDRVSEDVESAGGGGLMAPPPYSELSSYFGPLEKYAELCGMSEAGHYLRKAKMLFLAAHATKTARQTDTIVMFTELNHGR